MVLIKTLGLTELTDAANLLKNADLTHSYKKRNNSLETRAVLLTFLLELEISGVVVQRIHQNSKKWWLL